LRKIAWRANLGQSFSRLPSTIDFFAVFAKGERQLPITTAEPQRGGSQGRAAGFCGAFIAA